ncbi:MAG: glycosyltransferase family 39 protein [Candidatus Blackburnbacteria bacterium]|nr:glycosyltransferase family 39 protein [Candidatus Blackburnbacteria bacterium]
MVWTKTTKLHRALSAKYVLIAVIIFASILRLWKLSEVPPSLFGDELDVGYHAYSVLKTGKDYSGNFLPLHFQSLAEWRTPLYLYSAVPTVALFGISPLGVRLPAVIFGILGVWLFYLLVKLITGNWRLAILASFLLTVSPWHIQYSRAGFEVTQMLALYIAGIYFLLRGLKDGRWLSLSAISLGFTPWAYSTAKLFLPLTVLMIMIIWGRDLLRIKRKYVVRALLAFAIVVTPIFYSTVFGGGTARFNYISVFTDPTTVPEIGFARLRDAKMRNPEVGIGIQPTIVDRALHNKFIWWGDVLLRNYFQPYSTQFLFINGDLNPRHSPSGIGQLYKYEAPFLLLGVAFFLTRPFDKKVKLFFAFWLLASPIPAALTRDGGMHATRLFFWVAPLLFLVALGIYYSFELFKGLGRKIFILATVGVFVISFLFYQHKFWVHYPWDSERWWHAGYEDAIKTAVAESGKYDRVIISMSSEPAYIFFLGWSQFDPNIFHQNYQERGKGKWLPLETLPGFGQISKLEKYYFGSAGVDLYSLAQVLPDSSLYLATAKDVNVNLILEPERLPKDLKLIKSSPFPSGEPAYYLLTKNTLTQ